MIPYPGESLGIFQSWKAAGDTYGLGVSYRAGSSTITSGDEWRVWVAPGTTYLDAPADCDTGPVWVVVVDSGTATVTASEGADPSYGDTTAAHGTPLGTHTLTPGDNVIPSAAFTVADVWGGDPSMMLVLEATSGSAVVSQVKLRLWPSTGAAGGWSDLQPSWDTNPVDPVKQYAVQSYTGSGDSADIPASWDAAKAAFYADYAANSGAASRGFGSVPTVADSKQGLDTYTLGVWTSGWDMTAALVMLTGVDWTAQTPISGDLVEGVDWIRPPDEVDGDTAVVAQQVGDGSTGWVDATISITCTGDLPGDATLATYGGEWADDDPGSGIYYTTPAEAGAAVGSGTFPLNTSGRMSLAVIAHSMVTGVADTFPGWDSPASRQDDISYVLGPVKSYATLPPYRVWVPSAVKRRPLRQWPLEQGSGGSPRRYSQDALSSYGSGAPRRYGAGYQ